jgi:lamin tail-like protein/putative Ig domain-containing protein
VLSVDVTYTGAAAEPNGAITITELMHSPSRPGAQFIEIVNRSQMYFDLAFWRIDAVNYSFPVGSIVNPGQTIVLAQDKTAVLQTYGYVPVFDVFPGQLSPVGEPVALVRFSQQGDVVIDGVRYEAALPWPAPIDGASLQLVDAAQDNSRSSNWAYGTPTPGAPNSVAATLPPFDPVWLNEVQTETLVGPSDNAGDHDPWIELFNNSGVPINLSGYFLADNYSSNLTQWAFPAGATIAPGEYKLVWADGEPGESTATIWHTSFRLDYGGTIALVRLIGGQPQVTDYLTFPEPGANISYGDFPDAQPVFRSHLFHPTAGSTNLGHTIPVFINEWLARNTNSIRDPADNQLDDWFEVYNGGSQTINLGNYYFTDDAGRLNKFRVPNNGQYVIQPRSYMLVWADDNNPNQNAPGRDLHVPFRLGGNSGFIALVAPNANTVIDQITYGLQTNDITQGRFADGASTIYYTAKPTPRGPNTILGANTPPVFPFIATQFAVPGQRLVFTVRASDPQFPDQQSLTYSIVSGPPGIELNSAGVFRWIIPTNQLPGDYSVTLRVVDSGVPPRSATTTFIIAVRSTVTITTVAPAPIIDSIAAPNGQATFTILTTPGHTYRVLYTDELGTTAPWTQLDRDFVAANPYASISDFITSPHRFYRIYVVE